MKVKLFAYKDILIIETQDLDKEHPDFVPYGENKDGGFNIGCVLLNTEKNLGASKEAIKWLKDVKKSNDCIGDIDCFKQNDGVYVFGWLGGLYAVKQKKAEGSRSYTSDFPYIEIENTIPEGAKTYIDENEDTLKNEI